ELAWIHDRRVRAWRERHQALHPRGNKGFGGAAHTGQRKLFRRCLGGHRHGRG
ncbi:unnamed protein product, partial [Ectocarpus sp. 13 AM-2016]